MCNLLFNTIIFKYLEAGQLGEIDQAIEIKLIFVYFKKNC